MNSILLHDPNFIAPADADRFFAAIDALPWRQHILHMWGGTIPAPRLYQWIGPHCRRV
jgi:hypothetical protein